MILFKHLQQHFTFNSLLCDLAPFELLQSSNLAAWVRSLIAYLKGPNHCLLLHSPRWTGKQAVDSVIYSTLLYDYSELVSTVLVKNKHRMTNAAYKTCWHQHGLAPSVTTACKVVAAQGEWWINLLHHLDQSWKWRNHLSVTFTCHLGEPCLLQ